MGVLSGRDILTSKFITAEITDSEDRIHYVAIKHTIGDFFVADLDGKFFAFSLFIKLEYIFAVSRALSGGITEITISDSFEKF